MVRISFNEQAEVLRLLVSGRPKWIKQPQIAALQAVEKTLNELDVLRQHVQNLDPQDEQAINQVSAELLQLLKIVPPTDAVDALSA
jgi:hypothetical protein